jgi:hypothetical protein
MRRVNIAQPEFVCDEADPEGTVALDLGQGEAEPKKPTG